MGAVILPSQPIPFFRTKSEVSTLFSLDNPNLTRLGLILPVSGVVIKLQQMQHVYLTILSWKIMRILD